MKITLPLPGRLTSAFVVAVERLPVTVESLVPWRVTGHHRKAAVSAFGGPGLTVTHLRSPWRPEGVDLTGDERRMLRRAGQHLLVSTTAPPHALPASVQVARATARALARAYDGLIIDPLTGTTVSNCPRCPDEPAAFRLADGWVAWDVRPHGAVGAMSCSCDDPDGLALCPPCDRVVREACSSCDRAGREACPPSERAGREACSSCEPAWPGACPSCGPVCPGGCPSVPARDVACRGSCVTSRGLGRFALPEITLDGAACAHHLCATDLLRMVAHRLLTDQLAFVAAHPDAALRVIDDHLQLGEEPPDGGGAPFGDGGVSPCGGGTSFGVRLTPCDADAPDTGSPGGVRRLKVGPIHGTGQVACLKVGPPSGFTGSLDDWPCATREAGHDGPASGRLRGPAPSRALAA
ncbi:hypothetical protein [Nonomuraea sp. NPDC048916]|uniref:hypothetical protein n=1 Tax=Nonomuraea sp. NPDC048916 TaxID=3154232 RepID=UPI0033FB87EE